MTEIFRSETRLKVWSRATESLFQEDNQQDIILHINSPNKGDSCSQDAIRELNRMYREADREPIHTVAEWIFPGWLYRREGINGVYNTYPNQMEKFMEVRPSDWGTYAYRMVRRDSPKNGQTYNPLKTLIKKLYRANQPEHQTFRSCYELGIHEGQADIPLYDPSTDRREVRGAPCLSHLSFKLLDGDVHLTALYRAHDYRFKVPGNLLGLSRLQACIAQEIDAGIGQLVVHSSRAYIDQKGGIPEFREFVNDFIIENTG